MKPSDGALIIVSVSDRLPQLRELLESILRFPSLSCYRRYLHFQDNLGNRSDVPVHLFDDVLFSDRLKGCHAARVELLRTVRAQFYVNLDDDMELTRLTDYWVPAMHAQDPYVGFVLTNWARTMGQLRAKAPSMRKEFIRQVLVYQGGGMVYAEHTAALMRELPMKHQTFDTVWPLTAYVNGLMNYRYRGSLAVHRVCTKGGMHEYMSKRPPEADLTEGLVKLRYAKRRNGSGMDLCIPLDRDLTPEAHERHRAARRRIGAVRCES